MAGILICTAVALEAKPIAKRFGLRRIDARRWEGGEIELRTVGMGAVDMAGVEQRVEQIKPEVVVMAGLAGALSTELGIGAVVVDERSTFVVDDGKLKEGGMVRGGIHTVGAVAATVAEKARLREQTGAMVVEMENDVVRSMAGRLGVLFLGVRAISDTADQGVDPAMMGLVDAHGKARVRQIARLVAGQPGKIGELMRLGKNANQAAEQLAEALAFLLR